MGADVRDDLGGLIVRALVFAVTVALATPASGEGLIEGALKDFDSSTDAACLIGQTGAMLDRLKYDCRLPVSELEERIISKSITGKAIPCFDNITNRWPDFVKSQGGKSGACRFLRRQVDDWLSK